MAIAWGHTQETNPCSHYTHLGRERLLLPIVVVLLGRRGQRCLAARQVAKVLVRFEPQHELQHALEHGSVCLTGNYRPRPAAVTTSLPSASMTTPKANAAAAAATPQVVQLLTN